MSGDGRGMGSHMTPSPQTSPRPTTGQPLPRMPCLGKEVGEKGINEEGRALKDLHSFLKTLPAMVLRKPVGCCQATEVNSPALSCCVHKWMCSQISTFHA